MRNAAFGLGMLGTMQMSLGKTHVVNTASPQASDSGEGSEAQPFKTISQAAAQAMPGDTVLVHGGIYRERVAPARGGEEGAPIRYQAAPGETVIVRGSDVWQPDWQPHPQSAQVFTGTLAGVVSADFNPFHVKMRGDVGKKTLGQVFVDDRLLWEVETEEQLLRMEGTWYVSKDGQSVSVHFPSSPLPPAKRSVEITTRNRIFASKTRGLGHIEVDGFVFERCSNQFPGEGFWASDSPQAGAVSTRGGHNWIISNNVIRWATGYGLDCGSEGKFDTDGLNQPEPDTAGHHQILNNTVSDNGAGGIGIYRGPFTKVIGNVIERNNYMNSNLAYEDAGIKTHFFINGVIEGNLVRDNETSGIWLDNVYQGSRVSRNVVLNNKRAGIFCEMGAGSCLVDNNVVAYTRSDDGRSAGLYAHDASSVLVVNNLFYANASYGIYMRYMVDRPINIYPATFKNFGDQPVKVEPSACYGHGIYNNLFIANHRASINLIYPGKLAWDNHSEGNLFVTLVPFEKQFVINLTNGGDFDMMEKAWREASSAAGANGAQQPALQPFPEGVEVTLEQWRLLMGHDKLSQVVGHPLATHTLNSLFPELFLKINDSPWKVQCQPVPGVDRDFYGQAIDKTKILPGPFQNLKKGKNTFPLWKAALPAPAE